MKTKELIENLLELGYEYELLTDNLIVYRLWGKNLNHKRKIARVSIKEPYQMDLRLDVGSINDGVGEILIEYTQTSKIKRGRLGARLAKKTISALER